MGLCSHGSLSNNIVDMDIIYHAVGEVNNTVPSCNYLEYGRWTNFETPLISVCYTPSSGPLESNGSFSSSYS
jgi:hypothetical protein